MKKIYFLSLVVVQMLFAAWDGSSKTEPSIINIETHKFYQINSPEELAWFADKVNSKDTAINAILINDIDLNMKPWTPIVDFDGIFDGDNHSIEGVYVSGYSKAAFFGSVDRGTIKNLHISNSTIKAQFENKESGERSYAGGVAAVIGTGLIENVTSNVTLIEPNKNTKYGDSYFYMGGIVGYAGDFATLKNCTNHSSFSLASNVTNKTTNSFLGGVVGYFDGLRFQALDLQNYGNIAGGGYTGGIVGYLDGEGLSNAINYGTISGSKYVGGIAGKGGGSNLTNKGNIQIDSSQSCLYVGGISGIGARGDTLVTNYGNIYASSDSVIYLGGISGSASMIYYAANYGSIKAFSKEKAYAGGILGIATYQLINSYNQGNIQSSHYAAGLVSNTTQTALQIQIKNFYVASDSIKAPNAAGFVNYNSVTSYVSDGYLDTNRITAISLIGENVGEASNLFYRSTSELRQDSLAYKLDINQCNYGSCYKHSFYKKEKGHWSRENEYPIFSDSIHNPIIQVSFVNGNDTTIHYTDYSKKINPFPSINIDPFLGWFKYNPNGYMSKDKLISSNNSFEWSDSIVVALFKGDEEKGKELFAYCIDYMLDYQKEYAKIMREYYLHEGLSTTGIREDSIPVVYCLDDNNDGILNWSDPSSNSYSYLAAEKKSLEIAKQTVKIDYHHHRHIDFSAIAYNKIIQISCNSKGKDYTLFDMQGRIIRNGIVSSSKFNISVQNSGNYIILIGNTSQQIVVR